MTTYLLNSAVLTAFGEYVYSPVSLDAARVELECGYTSAIGHAGSAEFCSQLLEMDVSLNRITIEMKVGDRALVIRIKGRLPEGRSLSAAESQELPVEIGLLERVA